MDMDPGESGPHRQRHPLVLDSSVLLVTIQYGKLGEIWGCELIGLQVKKGAAVAKLCLSTDYSLDV